jgi:hypothetical protein
LTGELAPQYRKADKKKKTSLLDGVIQQTGYNRKYALPLLTHWGKEAFLPVDGKPVKLKAETVKRLKKMGRGGGRKPVCGPAVIASTGASPLHRGTAPSRGTAPIRTNLTGMAHLVPYSPLPFFTFKTFRYAPAIFKYL